ncbi:MAG TPA: hypothetical protein VJ111_08165 [Chitinophagaceae bacterium]|nr:hypothetical protein [Chitinophagaceae bacterium]
MQEYHQLLLTIYEIVKNDPQPEHYGCRPRELILRQLQEWSVIHQHLQLLQQEELIDMEQQDTLVIRITSAGIEKARQAKKRVNTND